MGVEGKLVPQMQLVELRLEFQVPFLRYQEVHLHLDLSLQRLKALIDLQSVSEHS